MKYIYSIYIYIYTHIYTHVHMYIIQSFEGSTIIPVLDQFLSQICLYYILNEKQCSKNTRNLAFDCPWKAGIQRTVCNEVFVILWTATVIALVKRNKMFPEKIKRQCGEVKHDLRVASYKFRFASYQFKFTNDELKSTNSEFKSRSCEFSSKSCEFNSRVAKSKTRVR